MSFLQKAPVVAASLAIAALVVAAPASAQSDGTKFASNAAGPQGSTMMAKQEGPGATPRPSTASQAPGSSPGSGLMARAGNSLK